MFLFTSGTHFENSTECDLEREVSKLQEVLDSMQADLFPAMLGDTRAITALKIADLNGGWGDKRDQELCKAIANNSATIQTIRSLQKPNAVL